MKFSDFFCKKRHFFLSFVFYFFVFPNFSDFVPTLVWQNFLVLFKFCNFSWKKLKLEDFKWFFVFKITACFQKISPTPRFLPKLSNRSFYRIQIFWQPWFTQVIKKKFVNLIWKFIYLSFKSKTTKK